MVKQYITDIFRNASVTYFNASRFFPSGIKDSVFQLYAYVRTADDFVDRKDTDEKGLKRYRKRTMDALDGTTEDDIVGEFAKMAEIYGFKREWIVAFLDSMQQDLKKQEYETLEEIEEYMYGSAEVIGLMMARIMKLPRKADPYAKALGKAMQYINIIRDIDEDFKLGRVYLPQSMLTRYGVEKIEPSEEFNELIRNEIERYREWQEMAERGYEYIPKDMLVAIKTAADMYQWTAEQIYENPAIIFEKKVKPSKARVLLQGSRNVINLG